MSIILAEHQPIYCKLLLEFFVAARILAVGIEEQVPANPERFVRHPPQPALPPAAVWINPPKRAHEHEGLQ